MIFKSISLSDLAVKSVISHHSRPWRRRLTILHEIFGQQVTLAPWHQVSV